MEIAKFHMVSFLVSELVLHSIVVTGKEKGVGLDLNPASVD